MGVMVAGFVYAESHAAESPGAQSGNVKIVPNLIGLGIGVPLLILSAYVYFDRNNKIAQLQYQQLNP